MNKQASLFSSTRNMHTRNILLSFLSPIPFCTHHHPNNLQTCTTTHQPTFKTPQHSRQPPTCIDPTPSETPNQPPLPTFSELQNLLQQNTKTSQQRAITYAFRLPPQQTITLLTPLLDTSLPNRPYTSTNDFIKASAAVCLGRAIGLYQHALPKSQKTTDLLFTNSTNILIRTLASDEDYGVRSAAAAGLGYCKSEQALFALRRSYFEDENWQVKFSALAGVGEVGDKRGVEVLKDGLKSGNDLVVQSAIGGLSQIGDESCVKLLVDLGGRKDVMTRQRVAMALGRIGKGGEVVEELLKRLLGDEARVVREAAFYSLGLLGVDVGEMEIGGDNGNGMGNGVIGKEQVEMVALRRQLERSFDKEFEVSSSSSASGDQPQKQQQQQQSRSTTRPATASQDESRSDNEWKVSQNGEEHGSKEFDELVKQLKHEDAARRALAAIRLRKYDASKALEAIRAVNAIEDPSERVRSAALALFSRGGDVETLIRTIEVDKDQTVRSAACDALLDTENSPEAVRACLKAFQHDEHWLVRSSAAIALGALGKMLKDEVVDVLIESLEKDGIKGLAPPQDQVLRRQSITALGFLGADKAVKAYEELLKYLKDEPIRYRVAAALRGIKTRDSIEMLRKMVSDKSRSVSEMAQGSLKLLMDEGIIE